MSEITEGAISRLLEAGRQMAGGSNVPEPAGVKPVVLVPAGLAVKDLVRDGAEPLPDYVKQVVNLAEEASFASYVNDYKGAGTRLFGAVPQGKESGGRLLAVFDYHAAPGKADGTGKMPDGPTGETPVPLALPAAAARCGHRAVYELPFSPAWKRWADIDRELLAQGEFVDFLEDNMPDVAAPNGADLLELASNFKNTTAVEFASRIDRTRGTVQLAYKETPESSGGGAAGAPGTIPIFEVMQLSLPVFQGGATYTVDARLRWLPQSGKLKVSVVLQRPEEVVALAFADVVSNVETATGLKVLIGAPETSGSPGSW